MNYFEPVIRWLEDLDSLFVEKLNQHEFSQALVHNDVSKYITEALFLIVSFIICYETLYWSGIYLRLWDYHAKDIFKEVPIHCAHVYVKINFAKRNSVDKVRDLYKIKSKNRYNVLEWKAPKEPESKLFLLKDFVKYHFEFSPEDFEENPEPEYGSTVEHLRNKVLSTITGTSVFENHLEKVQLDSSNVLIFNSKHLEVNEGDNKKYLSKANIETGNLIECVVLV